jgi:hypothetical protein
VLGALGAGAAMTSVMLSRPAGATFCSVFNHYPCAPTYCSPFRHRPRRPFYGFPLGENLQLTIESRSAETVLEQHAGDTTSPYDVDSIRTMFAALRACWQPPPEDQASNGLQMSVRLSFTRDGKLKGEPRVTYVTPGTPPEAKQVYEQAIKSSLERCTPLPFARGMGGAIAGRPIAIRFIDNRATKPK